MDKEKQLKRIALLMCQLTKEQQENVFKFMDLLIQIKDLPVKEQQIIVDNITDKGLLEIIEIYKNTLS